MCGIVGLVNRDGRAVDATLLKAMTDTLRHRGPDGEGQCVFGNIGLGHRRLSIIDVETGRQPMSNAAETIWVTFNGEIYNFRELRRELEGHGHVFRTHSDTEVLVHGYQQWGEGLVPRLRGMFAFGILDRAQRRLLLARDHFGIKPLVYHDSPARFVFASEMKAITRDPAIVRELDAEALADYFECGYIPAPRTIFRGIRKLLPGHLISLDLASGRPAEQRRYWRLECTGDSSLTEAQALEQLDALLSESVRGQLISDVPLGALLSGGIDSSAVVSVMARESPERIKTFCVGFDEADYSEVQHARAVAESFGTDHYERTVRPDIGDLLPRLVYYFDEPAADASAVPTYYVCRMARERVTVCLSGDGGDELFAGYQRYLACLDMARFDGVPQWLRRGTLGLLSRWYPREFPGGRYVAGVPQTPDERFIDYFRHQYGAIAIDRLFTDAIKSQLPPARPDFGYLRTALAVDTPDSLQRYLQVDATTYLPYDILNKVDITSMMNSLEVRPPLLDHKLAEFVARLPARYKLNQGRGKYLLKTLLAQRLPPSILQRPKMGFGVPIRGWLATKLRDITHQYLVDGPRVSGLLDRKLLRRMVEKNERDRYSKLGGKLWWMLFFEMWYQDVFQRSAPAHTDVVPDAPTSATARTRPRV